MDIKHLRYFCTIVEQGQISRAAKLLNIAQPALSQRLKELEKELDTCLIVRHERKWQITEAGQLLYERAQQLLDSLGRVPHEIKLLNKDPFSRLHVGVAPICFSYASRAITALHQEHPKMRFRLYVGDVSLMEELLDERRIDLALCRRPQHSGHYAVAPLPACGWVVAYPATLLRSHQAATLALADLDQVPLMILRRRRSSGLYENLLHLFIKRGIHPNILVESQDMYSLLQLLEQGVCAAVVLPSTEVSPAIAERYQIKPLDEPELKIQPYLIHRKNLDMNATVRAFIKALPLLENATPAAPSDILLPA